MNKPATKILRVFPRRTSMTPDDSYAFVRDPPLWRPEADEVHVSVTFTWDILEGKRLQQAWGVWYPVVKLGGPALGDSVGQFVSGRYLKDGVTITSRGCPNRCSWCLVPQNEGELRLLSITPGWIVQDNNLLATPRFHQKTVYAMLRDQRRQVSIVGGLDTRLIDEWVVDQLRHLRIKEVFLAADTDRSVGWLSEAVGRLDFLNRRQLRCYVLLGYEQTLEEARRRLEAVWDVGCLPFAQLYQPPEKYVKWPRMWRELAREWSRPAAMFAMHREAE